MENVFVEPSQMLRSGVVPVVYEIAFPLAIHICSLGVFLHQMLFQTAYSTEVVTVARTIN